MRIEPLRQGFILGSDSVGINNYYGGQSMTWFRLKIVTLTIVALAFSGDATNVVETCCASSTAKCTGSASCRACTNCSRCAHCKAGGSCGVCSGGMRSRSGGSTTSSAAAKMYPAEPSRSDSNMSLEMKAPAKRKREIPASSGERVCIGGICKACPKFQDSSPSCDSCEFCSDESRACSMCPVKKIKAWHRFFGPPRPLDS